MKVILWLTVQEKKPFLSDSKLWTKTIQTSQAPGPGEEVILWPDEEDNDPLQGPHWGVKSRYWDADGVVHCEMRSMVVDADDQTQQLIGQEIRTRRWTFGTWYTDQEDGRPEPRLERGGWRPYRP